MSPSPRAVVIQADGGSRGNPGPAAYGAVLTDADTGAVIAEDATRLGVVTNNVAEYHGLIAGLELARDHAPGASVEVRMDSKLVVEQMSGRWKIKHPDMKPLAARAAELAPAGTAYVWVPRGQNAHADRLANEAMDGLRDGVTVVGAASPEGDVKADAGYRGWSGPGGPPTTLVLLRHGVTPHTAAKRFSGGLASSNPGLSDEGKAQIRAAAQWLAPLAEQVAAVVASPVRRTRESAEIVAERLGAPLVEEAGFAEMEFGAWDGLTFGEVAARDQAGLDAWLGSTDVAPPGGESFETVQARVLAGLGRVLEEYAGRTIVVVSHVTPIKTLVAHAVEAPLAALFRMELTPASISVVSFFPPDDPDDPGGRPRGSMRLFNALPPGDSPFADRGRW